MSKKIRILRKTGRLVNGNESDAGLVFHAVADGTSLCGTKPGRLSSWSVYEGDKVTCPKCLRKLIAENDKEIEKLRHIERYDIGKMFLGNAKLIIEKRQFAISELEKVLTSVDVPNLNGNSQKSISLSRLRKVIQQQIKELKEKE